LEPSDPWTFVNRSSWTGHPLLKKEGPVRVPSPLPPNIGLLLKIFSETEKEGEGGDQGKREGKDILVD